MKTLAFSTALLGLSMSLCFGAMNGPVYPAPDGPFFTSQSGFNDGTGAGLVNTYSGGDLSSYGSLWWGPTNNTTDSSFLGWPAGIIGPAQDSMGGADGVGVMTFAGLQNVTGWTYSDAYVWNDSGYLWSFPSVFGNSTDLSTRFLLAFTGSADPTTKLAAGIASANPNEEVAQIVGNSFTASFVFQVEEPNGTWEGVDDYFSQRDGTCGNCVNTSEDFGFWYTSPTPEPRFYGFVLAGMIGLALFFRRRFLPTSL